jgi:hypothetical protein
VKGTVVMVDPQRLDGDLALVLPDPEDRLAWDELENYEWEWP